MSNKPKKQTPSKRSITNPFVLPSLLFLGFLVIIISAGWYLNGRDKQNLVLKPTLKSKVTGLSHLVNSWGNVKDTDVVSGYNASFEAAGTFDFYPQDKQTDFMFLITTYIDKADILALSEDGKEYTLFETVDLTSHNQFSRIEFASDNVSLSINSFMDTYQAKVNAKHFGVMFDPEGFVSTSQEIVEGKGVRETKSESIPELVFMTVNGETIFNFTGLSNFPPTTQAKEFIIKNPRNLKINDRLINLGNVKDIKISITKNDNQTFPFFVQGTFGFARLFIDTKYPFNFSTVMPYVYVAPPTGNLVIGNLPTISLQPEQNTLEIHGSYEDPLGINLLGQSPDDITIQVSGKTNYVLLNETNHINPSRWDLLGDGIRATLVASLLAALGSFVVQFIQAGKQLNS